MKTPLANELILFLGKHKDISARRLARESGVTPASILHITSGRRFDMQSANADKVRAAMQRLSSTPSLSS